MTVRLSEVIAILDLERTENAPATREYLQMARVEKRLGEIGDDVKSLVVTAGAIHPSPISSVTLARRAAESQRRNPFMVAREVF
jgi:hypothetical protein